MCVMLFAFNYRYTEVSRVSQSPCEIVARVSLTDGETRTLLYGTHLTVYFWKVIYSHVVSDVWPTRISCMDDPSINVCRIIEASCRCLGG